jgi:arylsulfatase
MGGPRPNIAIILVDCLRSRTVFEGGLLPNLPAIRSLISEGTSFPETVATATVTTPSVGSLFTGTLPSTHGIRGLNSGKLNSRIATVAEVLRDHGYHTHAEATEPILPQFGFDRGFDFFNHRTSEDNVYSDFWNRFQERFSSLSSRDPWFLYLHLFELHEFAAMAPGFDRRRFGATSYERALVSLDQSRLRSFLDLLGPQTIVILTADHGEIVPRFHLLVRIGERIGRQLHIPAVRRAFEDRHGHGNNVTEDLVLVPLVIRGPGIPSGLRVEAPVRHVDLFPTILDLAGIDDPRRSQTVGESLREFFHGNGHARTGYSEGLDSRLGYPRPPRVSVRSGGWKYAETLDGSTRSLWRLPDERHEVSAKNPTIVEHMRTLLGGFTEKEEVSQAVSLSPHEQVEVEAHLRDLGYID